MLGKFTELTSTPDHIVIDIETYDPRLKESGASWIRNEGYILGIAVKIDNLPSEYYPLKHHSDNYDYDKVKNYINYLQDFNINWLDIPFIFHYGYYDLGWLDHEKFININSALKIKDTLIMSQLFHSQLQSYSLDFMTKYFQCGKKSEMDFNLLPKLPPSAAAIYACNDADITHNLYEVLKTKNLDSIAVERECSVIRILVMMKKQGIKIDMKRLKELEKQFSRAYVEYIARVHEVDPKCKIWAGASIEILFKRLGLQYPRTELGNPSFTQAFLESINNPIIESLSKARKLHKLINTFITGIKLLQTNGIIHPDYYNGKSDDGGTVTGRLSSANPNEQQIPNRTEEGKLIRSLMIPFNSAWGRFDYSQQEPRLSLHYASKLNLSGIDEWKIKYEIDPDTDFYNLLIKVTGINDRDIMKIITLALTYGMGEQHMADMLKVDLIIARQYRDQFYRTVPWLIKLRELVQQKVHDRGYIKTLGNRTLRFDKRDSNKCFNHLIQGSAADQTKQAMLSIYNNTGKIPLSQVHDELNFDLKEEELSNGVCETISNCMKNAYQLNFPVKVDFSLGLNWMEACKK